MQCDGCKVVIEVVVSKTIRKYKPAGRGEGGHRGRCRQRTRRRRRDEADEQEEGQSRLSLYVWLRMEDIRWGTRETGPGLYSNLEEAAWSEAGDWKRRPCCRS